MVGERSGFGNLFKPPPPVVMQKTVLIAIVAVVAIVAVGGGAMAIMQMNSDSSETADTIVGHSFEYKVVGNHDDKLVSGTQIVTILSEKDNRYEVKTERNVYADTTHGSRTVLWDDVNTEWKNINDIVKPGTFSKDFKLGTYWGEKNVKVYTKTVDSTKTTSYVAYEKISFETVVEDGDNLYIYMMNKTNFMNEDKSVTPHSYKMTLSLEGTMIDTSDPSTLYNLTGTMSEELIDATGTASETKTKTLIKMGLITITDSEETEWSYDDEDFDSHYGTKSGTSNVTTMWGTVITDVYVKTANGYTATTYLYKDLIPVKISMTGIADDYTMDVTYTFSEFVLDDESLDSLEKLDKAIEKLS